MIKKPQNPSPESRIFHSSPVQSEWNALTDGSAFSKHLARVISSAQARELREELRALDTEPDRIRKKALDRAWDCWCNLTGMDEWNQPGILADRHSVKQSPGLKVLCRLDQLDGRAAFPQMAISGMKREVADVRFLMAANQSLEEARTWQIELMRLDAVVNWPEMLLKLTQEELRKARIEVEGIKRKQLATQHECDLCLDAWTEATWHLLSQGAWSSLQGEELHQASTAMEVIEAKSGCEKAPFWEWKHRDRPTIILAIRLIQPSKSGKRWLVEGRMVSDDLFSSPQGQTTFTTWKRTSELKKQLRLHLDSLCD